jgi:hypothetical protein
VRPIATYDSEYGNASFVKQTAGIEADLLLRLRSNMCLWGAPPPYSGKGRPKVHGHKFKLADSTLGESLLPHGDRRPEVGNSCDSTRLLGYTSAPLLCISYKCYGLSFLASMLASAPQADVAGLAGWVNACVGADMATLPPQVCRWPLESVREAEITLDTTSLRYNWAGRTLERPHAVAQFAVMAGAWDS